jgi:bifunctional non-homologous end joining protein LigD
MLLTAARQVPLGDGWVHEPKLDGMRTGVRVADGRVWVWSRRHRNWTDSVSELAKLLELGTDVVIDGEPVALGPDGRPDFELLMGAVNSANRSKDRDAPVDLYAFDVLEVAGQEVMDQPWEARREQLEKLGMEERTDGAIGTVSYSADGTGMHQATLELGMEGVVSKRTTSQYLPGSAHPGLAEGQAPP